MRKLDATKSYGTVTNHPSGAVFEQDGVLFGGNGLPIGEQLEEKPKAAPAKARLSVQDTEISPATFLRKLLKEGGMRKNVVFKESELQGQSWDAVQKSFLEIGQAYTQGKTLMWKLAEPEHAGA